MNPRFLSPLWDIPLGRPPAVVAIGRNAHGFEPVDRYCLPDLWSLHVYGYEAALRVGELELAIRPGRASVTPPGKEMEFRYVGISVHLYVHFRLSSVGPTVRVPAMQDLGDRYDLVYERLYGVMGLQAEQPERVNARVWDLLWELCASPLDRGGAAEMHPAVRRATELISRNLAEPLTVGELAREADVSYSYLARLFQEAFGESVVGYIRQRRLERAAHLLQRSTLPIKAIAASVGIPDLQHFNKAIRGAYGVGPRSLREGAASE